LSDGLQSLDFPGFNHFMEHLNYYIQLKR